MPDFKGRKDFPEVADDKIKIGDYSGMNRLSVVDIYSPKEEPELRDQIMEPVKGESNNYDSPILSQQPVIILSDDGSEEATLMKAIDGYVEKHNGNNTTDSDAPFSGTDPMPKREEFSDQEPPEPKPDYGRKLKRRYEKADTIEKKGPKQADTERHPDTPPGVIQGGSKHVGEGLHLRGQKDAEKLAGPVTSIMPGDPGHDEIKREMDEKAEQNKQQGHTQHRPLVTPIDAADVDDINKSMDLDEPSRSWSYQG